MKITLLVLLALTRASIADPLPIAQDPKSAQDLYAEGQAAYARGDYATAIDRWQISYQVSGESALLFNVAQALRLSGNCARAIETYRLFMVADPDATSDQHRLADEFVRELSPTCPSSPPPRQATPAPIHGKPPVAIATPPETARARTGEILDLTTAGAGTIAIVVGLTIGHHGQSIGTEITSACARGCDWTAQAPRDASGRRDVTIGYALDGVGAAAIVGAAIAYFVRIHHATRDTIVVAPNLGEGGASVSWIGSW